MNKITLCVPFDNTSCFRCCPPIRPAHYDHLLYAKSLKREFIENTTKIEERLKSPRKIIGFYCWALGYLDSGFKQIGCLLHPAQRGGKDLRYLTGYGEKCLREMCLQGRIFSKLTEPVKVFWLEITKGLNSFYFSSERANPIFHILLWGEKILSGLYSYSKQKEWNATELLWRLNFLMALNPRAWRLPVELLMEISKDYENINWHSFFQETAKEINSWKLEGHGSYAHLLDVSNSLKDFLRFFLRILKTNLQDAIKLEKKLRKFLEENHRKFCH